MGVTKRKNVVIKWNRKIHIYLGLFLLLFIWLFGISGVLLNHHWEIANSWERREEFNFDKSIQISEEREKYPLAHEIMNELDLKGSIYNLRFSSDSSSLNFVVAKPGTRYEIQAQLNDGKIQIKGTRLDSWDMMRTLHKLRNPTLKEQSKRYPSALASIWSVSIDFVSAGVIVICLGGWYMWLQVSGRRFYLGLLSITAGLAMCIYFLLF
jgi:hypothetical protein